ncbi:MAG: MBL fold metallo-hydrolase [Chitinophagaceae bacterium]|nr:MBL fold metallo-hydrolase [Chitinophagaceae bacterium]
MAKAATTGRITEVRARMYCLGTGDCFVYKFYSGRTHRFTMMVDCGSCQGTKDDFLPYLEDLATYVDNTIDLLVITHEHNDHVNGFHKCPEIFENKKMTIREAWFAWTEHPDDPGGRAKDLQEKKKKMKHAFSNALAAIKSKAGDIETNLSGDKNKVRALNNHDAFVTGLNTLADVNLGVAGNPLPGMTAIKNILEVKKTKIQYLEPGATIKISKLPGLKFHILGPPFDTESVYKHEKEGTDVFQKNKKSGFSFGDFSMAINAFSSIGTEAGEKDIPFHDRYLVPKEEQQSRQMSIQTTIMRQTTYNEEKQKPAVTDQINKATRDLYFADGNEWRKIDLDWLNSAGSLALRLNSHINNTSLVLAIESEGPGNKVMLLPGDAEFGSWQSWYAIEKWKKKGRNEKHLVEDLLNRTVFYKVSHHLSYNGTALDLGFNKMESDELVAMATLDRKRIAKKWKGTMPNKKLLNELIKKCKGKVFMMNEFDVRDAPGKTLPRASLPKTEFESLEEFDQKKYPGKKGPVYLQYNVKL